MQTQKCTVPRHSSVVGRKGEESLDMQIKNGRGQMFISKSMDVTQTQEITLVQLINFQRGRRQLLCLCPPPGFAEASLRNCFSVARCADVVVFFFPPLLFFLCAAAGIFLVTLEGQPTHCDIRSGT